MKLHRIMLLGGIQLGPNGEPTSARDNITSVGLLKPDSALPLGGCCLFAELTCDAKEPETQAMKVTLSGPPGDIVLADSTISFGPPHNGVRAAGVTVPLDRFGLKKIGTYKFSLQSGTTVVGEIDISAAIARGRAKARFSAFLQDQQGIAGTERYLNARLPFALFDGSSAFCGYHMVHIRQRDGDNFEIDALELTIAQGGEALNDAYDFRVAVHRAYAAYAGQMFGGQMTTGSSIMMSHNLLQGDQVIEFDLPELDRAAGW